MTVSYSIVIWALRRAGRSLGRSATTGIAWAIVLATAGVVSGWSGVGLALAGSYIVQFTPAVVAAYRTRSPTGISPVTWGSIVIESALWGAYGFLNEDRPIVIYAAVGVVGGLAILTRYRTTVARVIGASEPSA
jgi:uncharacterized protein with PQ loop repeat